MKRLLGILALALTAATAQGAPATAPDQAASPATRPWDDLPAGARVTDEGWFLDPAPAAERLTRPDKVERAFVIPIRSQITPTLAEIIRRKIVRCRAGGAQVVIFDVDSPGGRVDAMDDIIQMILDELPGVYTVAWVHPNAHSAAAIISLACHEIVMVGSGQIGDAMPLLIGQDGAPQALPEEIRAKIESPLLAKVRTLAERNGYDPDLLSSMVTLKLEVWLVRHRRTGQLRIVDAGEWAGKVVKPPSSQPDASAKIIDSEWEYLLRIDPADRLLTLTTKEAARYGVSRATTNTMADLRQRYRIAAEPTHLVDNWSERLTGFLTSAPVMGILFFAAIFFAYIEMNTPGFGVPGAIAIFCFALMLGSQFLVGLANWWEIGLLVVGVALLLVELLILPGFGVAGLTGIVAIVAALLAMLIANPPDQLPLPRTNLDWSVFTNGLFAMMVGLVASVPAILIAARYLPKVPLARRLFLGPAPAFVGPPVSDSSPIRRIEVGAEGTVVARCRPVGLVRFGEDLLAASSQGEMIEPGTRIRVLRRDGNRLVIEPVQEAS